MIWWGASFCVQLAAGQELGLDRPIIPGASIAAEDGPGSLWVNPANMAYDPDLRYGLYVPFMVGKNPQAVAGSAGIGGLSVGVQNQSEDEEHSNWSLDYATSIKLPQRVSIGARAGWHLIDSGSNYVTWDFGLSWRPIPWFGVGAVFRNAGSPSPDAASATGFGVALRPFGRTVTLGADYLHTFGEASDDRITGTLRVRPTKGLYLRASADTRGTFGGGVEFYFGRVGVGGFAAVNDGDVGITAYAGNDEPGETLIRGGSRIPVLTLDHVPPYQSSASLFEPAETTWVETLQRLREAETDRSVRGVALVFRGAPLSWARRTELRQRILALQAAGKPCLAYLHGSATTADYYVASAATKIMVHPTTDIQLTGIRAELTYLRGAFDLVGVEPQFVRRSEYKSAVEAYTSTEPSAASLEQTEAWLDDLHQTLSQAIVEGRHVDPEKVAAWIDGGPWTVREAVEQGMVDGVLYPDQLDDELARMHGRRVRPLPLEKMPRPISGWKASSQVAVINIEGTIVPGHSSEGGLLSSQTTGSDTIRDMMERARLDGQVRAVVLRIDSPGGSAFASDEIHRGIKRLKAAGKPVVVSMGGVAASGGYYVATGADAIWAEPSTITGSIGVFSGKMSVGGLLDRVGVSTVTLNRGRNASIDSNTEPWDAVQTARMQALVDHIYEDFKKKVGEGRGLTPEQVEEVAKGRVWTGTRAKEVGLVDDLGGLTDAVDDARQRAGIPIHRTVELVTYTPAGTLIDALSPMKMRSPVLRATVGRVPMIAQMAGPKLDLPEHLFADSWSPLLTVARYPEQVWMMDTELVNVDVR